MTTFDVFNLDKAEIATADQTGQAQFVFEPVVLSSVWTGTVTCPAAPNGAFFMPNIGGIPWPSWAGPGPAGPFQAWPGQVLTVNVQGLIPTKQYSLQWFGTSEPATPGVKPIYPTVGSAPLVQNIDFQNNLTIPSGALGLSFLPYAIGATGVSLRLFTGSNTVLARLDWSVINNAGALQVVKQQNIGVFHGNASVILPAQGTQLTMTLTSQLAGATGAGFNLTQLPWSGSRLWDWGIGFGGQLLAQQNIALGAGASVPLDLQYTWGGPAMLYIISNQPWTVDFYYLDGTIAIPGAQFMHLQSTDFGAGTDMERELDLPPLPVHVVLTNNGGVAGNFWITVTPRLF